MRVNNGTFAARHQHNGRAMPLMQYIRSACEQLDVCTIVLYISMHDANRLELRTLPIIKKLNRFTIFSSSNCIMSDARRSHRQCSHWNMVIHMAAQCKLPPNIGRNSPITRMFFAVHFSPFIKNGFTFSINVSAFLGMELDILIGFL